MLKPLTLLALASALTAPAAARAENGRLPAGVTPLAYAIEIDPDAAALTFAARSTATVNVAAPTQTITLNAVDLAIAEATLDGTRPATVLVDASAQTATLSFAQPVAAGQHTLAFRYTGKIYQAATGMFAIDYPGRDGKNARMLVTQFEPADARRLAPLFDEPGFKTPFTLAVTAPAGQTAFSNMPLATTAPAAGGKTLYRFQPTPKMSTYLMFLGVGAIDRATDRGGATEIGVITRPGVADQGRYALTSARRILNAYNDYFGTPYPLPKMDMIAGPGQSQFFGAMENWGAIFYFERVLLQDPRFATESQKQDIFNVVAHEMAHQWFGDLVTMAWWDDLWLNEGFASWMASKISGDLNPSWNATSQTLAFDRQAAMTRDAAATTHPIIQHVETPDQINQAFDDITYRKGEAVIRMLEGDVGPDVFRAGVRRYMAKYKYGNTVTDQLWAEVSAAAGRDVAPFMHSFTRQGGVPLIRVGEPSCSGGRTVVPLSQGRYGLDAPSKAARSWIVPVNVALLEGGATRVEVSGPSGTSATLARCGTAIVNAGQTGYFRTLYGDAHFARLRAAFPQLKLDDQLGLIGDAYGLAASGDAGLERHLSLVDRLTPASDPLVWQMVTSELNGIRTTLGETSAGVAFGRKAARVLAPAFARVGWTAQPNENPGLTQLRESLIPALGRFSDQAVVAEARRLARLGFERPDAVQPDVRTAALSVFARNATPADWEYILARARAETSPVARERYYRLLGEAYDPALAKRALDLALTPEIQPALKGNVIAEVTPNHPELAFDFAVAHKDEVNAALEASTRAAFIVSLPAASADPAYAAKVRSYARANLPEGSRVPSETAALAIERRAALRARYAPAVTAWAAR